MTFIMMDAYRYCPPAASSFGTTYSTNSQSPTKADSATSGLQMVFGNSPAAGADNLRAFTKAKASSPTTYDLIARLRYTLTGFDFSMTGLGVSDGTKWVTWQFSDSTNASLRGGHALRCDRFNSNTSFNSARYESPMLPQDYEWLRIGVVSGDPKDFYVSENGTDWVKMFTESQTAFLTYTQVGITQYITRSAGTFPVAGTNQITTSYLYFSDPDIVPPV